MRELKADALADRAIQVFGLFQDFGGLADRQPNEKRAREPVEFGELFPVDFLLT